jgi:chromosomal replication initiator protein DnaA
MSLKDFKIIEAPSPKDSKRHKLNLAAEEEYVKKLLSKLGGMCSRPFPSPEEGFQWSCFLYDLAGPDKEKLDAELKKLVAGGGGSPEGNIEESKKPAEVSAPEPAPVAIDPPSRPSGEKPELPAPQLKPSHTFSSFVVGANTRFTYAACKAVAEKPGKSYNPLFIYGDSGLGKTHLMHAIGLEVQNTHPGMNIVYISTSEFINEVVDFIEKGEIKELRQQYKSVDLLLMDDIQFLEQSESTQEEFFHIFNTMHSVGKQIVITSDKPPKKLTTLEDRLKSRFEWGLTTDIKLPNLETRKAIIKKKAVDANIELNDEINDYISEKLTSNIRELEGIINRVAAYQELSDDSVSISMIKEIISNILPSEEKTDTGADEPAEKKSDSKKHKTAHSEFRKPRQQNLPPLQERNPYPPPQPSYSPPPQPFPGQNSAAPSCPRCSMPNLTFIPQYKRWYCPACRMYVDPVQQYPQQFPGPYGPATPPYPPPPGGGQYPAPPVRSCHKCGNALDFIREYNRYYCSFCREYEQEQPRQAPPPPPGGSSRNDYDEGYSEEEGKDYEESYYEEEEAEPEPAPAPKKEKPEKKESDKKENKSEVSADDFESGVIGVARSGIREIIAGYFIPEGAKQYFRDIYEKLNKLAGQKKFNFFIKPLFVHYYPPDVAINFDKIVHMAVTNSVDIAICMEAGEKSGLSFKEFSDRIGSAMDKESMPFEVLPQEEIKGSDALNLMLDIAICAKKRKN